MSNNEENIIEGNFIGLDVGEKRIGVARINSFVKIAEPLDIIYAENDNLKNDLQELIDVYEANGIVIGLPRGLDGQETEQTRYCREIALNLQKELSLPVYMVDEAGSTEAAKERVQSYPNANIDSLAATIFLEDFISIKNKSALRVING